MSTLVTIIFVLIVMIGVITIPEIATFGWPRRESALDVFFREHPLENYSLNDRDPGLRMLFSLNGPYIARLRGVVGKWHIGGFGIVPRRSKWEKRIDQYHGLLVEIYKNNHK